MSAKIKVVVASTSDVKLGVVRKIFGDNANIEIVGIKVPSNVPEQPFDKQATDGARVRAEGAMKAVPDADLVIAIENGIFTDDPHARYVDKGIVAVMTRGMQSASDAFLETSDGVFFDKQIITHDGGTKTAADAVVEARKRGVDVWTAGKVMAEWNANLDHADPHKYLTGTSRAKYLEHALKRVVSRPEIKNVLAA